jgi:PhzF family phenazine biosynthesis protein
VLSGLRIPVAELSSVLGVDEDALVDQPAPKRSQDGDLIVLIGDVARLTECRPDFAALKAWCQRSGIRGVCLATRNTLSPAIHVQSRFFAPAVGVTEDPVTGSVHGPLAAVVAELGGGAVGDEVTALTCVQGIPGGRTGLVHALVQKQKPDRYAVRIGGRAVLTMQGTIRA